MVSCSMGISLSFNSTMTSAGSQSGAETVKRLAISSKGMSSSMAVTVKVVDVSPAAMVCFEVKEKRVASSLCSVTSKGWAVASGNVTVNCTFSPSVISVFEAVTANCGRWVKSMVPAVACVNTLRLSDDESMALVIERLPKSSVQSSFFCRREDATAPSPAEMFLPVGDQMRMRRVSMPLSKPI